MLGLQRSHGGHTLRRRIGLVAPPWYPVPPRGYGGIELVVSLLAGAQRAAGHAVVAVGAEGSSWEVSVGAPAAWTADLGRPQERLRELAYATRAWDLLLRAAPLDVIHDHCGFATLLALALAGEAPVVHTVHGPVTEPERTFYAALDRRVALVAISDSQRCSAPELNWVATVHNAVDLDQLQVPSGLERTGHLLCLARICAEKGQHLAIEVARRTGRRLVLAGKIDSSPAGHAYHRERVAPHIDGDRVVHIPDVGGPAKTRLLAEASALLAPIQWEEPFGLAMVEAMACGTPVVAMARGAAPELIQSGTTGFLVDDVDQMVGALELVDEVAPERCAQLTRERFSPSRMATGYLAAYDRVISGSAPQPPVALVKTALAG